MLMLAATCVAASARGAASHHASALARHAGPRARARAQHTVLRASARSTSRDDEPGASAEGGSVRAALRGAVDALRAAGVPEPDASAEFLLAHVLGSQSRGILATHGLEPLAPAHRAEFGRMVAERLARKPVQLIIGEWSFLELTLRVRAPVLVPRPETEELVELALARCAAFSAPPHVDAGCGPAPPVHVLDVGCGTGAIGLAVLARVPHARCTAIDVAEEAVSLARQNARALGLDARYESILLPIERLAPSAADAQADGRAVSGGAPAALYDVLLSNPPYIPEADMPSLEPEVAAWEDKRALCGGREGLDVIIAILERAPALLRARGCEVWLEVDPTHPPLIRAWLGDRPHVRLEFVESIRDFNGHERFCRLRVT